MSVMEMYFSFGKEKLHMNTTSLLPFFGTDFGLCSVIKPQVKSNRKILMDFKNFVKIAFSPDEEIRNMPWDYKMFGGVEIKKGAKVGKSNGLSLLLDAESFDYMFQVIITHPINMPVTADSAS